MNRNSLFLALVLYCMVVCVFLLIPGCEISMTTAPPDPIAVTPRDTSAATLDVTVMIFEDQEATDNTSNITLSFSTFVIEENNYVLFDDPNEEVRCNTVQGKLGTSPSYTLYVRRSSYACMYSGNTNDGTPLSYVPMFTIPLRSELSPQPPTITSNGFSLHYTPDPDYLCTIQGKATDSASDPPVVGPILPSNQGEYSGPSTSSLHGNGDIFLIRTCHWQHLPGEFHNIDLTYVSQASVEVTWTH